MRKMFMVSIVAVVALAFLTALLIPTPAGVCPLEKGKGKKVACRVDPNNPPYCPPCEEFDFCRCRCRKIPTCKLNVLDPPPPFPGG